MDQKEWRYLRDNHRELLDFTHYNNTRKIQKSLQYNDDPNANIIHHLRDTEEQREYNDAHYELWGFEIDENGNAHFEYGKYVMFVTEEWHHNYHRLSEETRKKISETSKKMWRDDTYNEEYRNKVICALKASWTDEKRASHSEKFKGKNNPMYGLKGKNHPAFGHVLSEETRKKMSDSWTDDRRRLQSERISGENNYNYGQSLSDDIKGRISNTLKEYFKTHTNSMSGKHHSETARARMSAAWTDERRRKCKELNEHRKFVYNKYKDFGGNLCWHDFISLLCKLQRTLSSLSEEDMTQLLLEHNK